MQGSGPSSALFEESYSVKGSEAQGFQRQVINDAKIRVAVKNIPTAVEKADTLVLSLAGCIDYSYSDGESKASMMLRVPSDQLAFALESLSSLGTERSRQIASRDVTANVIDYEARLKNNVALRDRLTNLLERANAVEEILKIETELSRVQAEIDSMEGQLNALRKDVAMSRIDLDLVIQHVPGPLGVVAQGIGWFAKKLFILY